MVALAFSDGERVRRMRKMEKSSAGNMRIIHGFLEKGIKYVVVIPLLLLTVLTLLFQNSITFDAFEISSVNSNGLKFYIMTLGTFVILYFVCILLKKIPEPVLFILFSIIYIVAGTYLITHIQMNLRHDSGICYWNALNFVDSIFTNLQQGEYFYLNPHQLGLATYNCLLIWLSDDLNFVFFVNLFWILITNLCLWRTTALLSEKSLVRKLVILLSFAFLPQFFYLFYAYGQVPGLGCLAIALYLGARAIKKECKWCALLSAVCIAGACVVRMNYLIGGIALIIIYLLKALKNSKVFYVVASICVVCAMLLPSRFICGYYENAADTDLNHGIPSILYVAMGLQECSEGWRAAGWFNGFNHDTHHANNYDVDKSTQVAMEAIGERFQEFMEDPGYALDFFGEKIITTWCEPTFQSVWSGPLISLKNETPVEFLRDLYSGGMSFLILSSMMNILNVMIFGFALMLVLRKTIWKKGELNTVELFGVLFLTGGFVFHIFWETSSQYVYPYVVMVIPVAAYGINAAFESVKGKIEERFKIDDN